jgi:hypothetical protein
MRLMARFVIVFQGTQDPSPSAVQALLARLKGVEVVDEMPGTLMVEGSKAQLSSQLSGLTDWCMSPAQVANVRPPRRLKAAA